MHPLNIYSILRAFKVLKFDKSKYSISVQNLNIEDIYITLFVINLFIPFISFNSVQPKNIHSILITLEVLNFDKSKYSNSSQILNIEAIFFTLSVVNIFIPFIFFNFLQWQKRYDISITFEVFQIDKSKYSNSKQY